MPAISLRLLTFDPEIQPRAHLCEETIADYAAALQDGARFPAISVVWDGDKHWVVDGWLRCRAYQVAGRTEILADVCRGTRRDAILRSVGSNVKHGLRRTWADKRMIVRKLLADVEWGLWSDRVIARQCAVSPAFVGNVRKAMLVENPKAVATERRFVHWRSGKITPLRNGDRCGPQRAACSQEETVDRLLHCADLVQLAWDKAGPASRRAVIEGTFCVSEQNGRVLIDVGEAPAVELAEAAD
jgi:hypothetical protein